MTLESEEESGSPNLLTLLKDAEPLIGKPDALFCMDSGAMDHEQLWLTSSLRGICVIDLTVECGKVGYHSGETGGVIPETFRIVRSLLDRIDEPLTGKVCQDFQKEVPAAKRKEAEYLAKKYGSQLYSTYELHEGVQTMSQNDLEEQYLNKTWHPNMSITGADGLPAIDIAGNVLRPKTTVRISLRLPPVFDAEEGRKILHDKLSTDIPHHAKVTLQGGHAGSGWCMKKLDPWLDQAFDYAAKKYFDGLPYGSFGEGGSIPFLKELERKYPEAQIVALGVLTSESNAHGPNENINLLYAKKLTKCLAHIIAESGKL